MKPFQFMPVKIVAAIVGLAALGATSSVYGGSGGSDFTSRLVIHRAADFGTLIALNVFVDGVQVTMLPQNTGYEALLTPGDHVLSVSTSPCPYGKTRYTSKHVRMNRGETYAYTAMWHYADVAQLDNQRAVDLVRNWY